jgi:hypothetical protein
MIKFHVLRKMLKLDTVGTAGIWCVSFLQHPIIIIHANPSADLGFEGADTHSFFSQTYSHVITFCLLG